MKKIETYLNGITNKKMLVVFPHPDDESVMAGGIILRAINLGHAVTVLTITEGGRGKIHINGRGRSVAEIRRSEMAEAMSVLGVEDWIMWKFDDGRLRKTNGWRRRLRDFVEATNPGIVVSYDLSGVSGHPDHISLSRELLAIFREQKEMEMLWVSFVDEWKSRIVGSKVVKYLEKPKFELKLSLVEAMKKWRAAFSHQSQGLGGFLKYTWWMLPVVARREYFSKADRKKKYQFRYIQFRI